MRLNLSGICAALFIFLSAPAFAAADTAPATTIVASQEAAARIDSMMSPYFTASTPGVTVIVVRDGKTLFRKAYGMADVARQQPMTPETVMRLGSLTKQFTATAIMMLAEEGKLALTDEITRFLPDYPTHGQKITIEHLLTHTSGIKNFLEKPDFPGRMAADVTVTQMIDWFKNDPLDFAPGTDLRYNNSAYFLLGAIIEKTSGLPYAKFLEQRIFAPLGMTHTAYEGYERGAGPRALGYSPNQAGFLPAPPISMTQGYAAGGLVSTVDDLARWDAAVSAGKLLTAADWKRVFTPYRLSTGKATAYGYGWRIGQLQGTPMIAHTGNINGFHTFALRLPEQHVYVAVLSNAGAGLVDPEMLAQKAAAIVIGKPFPEYKEIALDSATLDAYAGVYQMDRSGTRVFRRVKDQLIMQRSGRRAVPVRAISHSEFLIQGTMDRLEFKRNAKGEVTDVVSYHDADVTVNPRLGPAPPPRQAVAMSNAAFDAHAGRYEFAPDVGLQLSRDGDKFFAQRTGQQKLQIFALSDNAFFSDEVDAEIRFEPATAQSPARVVLNQGGRELQGKKID